MLRIVSKALENKRAKLQDVSLGGLKRSLLGTGSKKACFQQKEKMGVERQRGKSLAR